MKTNTSITPTNKLVDLVLNEIKEYENGGINLTDNVYFSQYDTIQTIKTHQNKGFLTPLADGQKDDREFYDIISPMVETAVVNIDLDTNNFEPYTVNNEHQAQEMLAKSLLNTHLKQANQGEIINSHEEAYIDDGNVVSRKIGKNKNGEIYKMVHLQNLYVIDQSAETLEDTPVIEKEVLTQSKLREMKELKHVDDVIELGNFSDSKKTPYYELFYRLGEVAKSDFNYALNDLNDTPYEEKEDDKNVFIPALLIVARVKKGKKDYAYKNGLDAQSKGVLMFIEELKPEVIKISHNLEITKYKHYEEAHFGKYCGRWMRQGYREIGTPYQNRANELGNQIRKVMKLASKILFWSKDKQLVGKNVLSAVKDGQVISTDHLEVLNNVFPDLGLFAEEWNRNINECQKALKAFEAASGANLPSSTSATAVAIQNQQIGKYYDFKREKLGIYFANIWKRWVIPILLNQTTTEEKMEMVGDASFIEEYVDAVANGWIIKNVMLAVALSNGLMTQDQFAQLKEMKKQELLKSKKHFVELEKDFFKDVEIYIGINPTGELFNKQARISNGLQLLQYLTNPVVMQDPASRDIVMDIAVSLGFRIKPSQLTPQLAPTLPNQQTTPATGNQGNKPMKEPAATDQVNPNMV